MKSHEIKDMDGLTIDHQDYSLVHSFAEFDLHAAS